MLNTSTIQENWERVREKAQKKWLQLEASDLHEFGGNVEELVSRIQHKTGASHDSIVSFLQTASEEGATVVNRVRDKIGESVSSARESVGNVAERAKDGYRQVRERTGQTVQERPVISLGAAFGVGVLVGVGLSLWLIDFESESMARRYSRQAENLGRTFWDSISRHLPDALSRTT